MVERYRREQTQEELKDQLEELELKRKLELGMIDQAEYDTMLETNKWFAETIGKLDYRPIPKKNGTGSRY